MNGTSREIQDVALTAFIRDQYLLGKCVDDVSESFFENPIYKLIFKCLRLYYKKYMVNPSQKELEIYINDNYSDDYGNKEDVIKAVPPLYIEQYSEDFLYERVIDFIRRNKIERSLNEVVSYMSKGEIDLDKVAIDLRESIYINFSKSKIMNLADVTKIGEAREEVLGTSDNPIMVKMFIEALNWCMQYNGLIPGTLNMVTAPPGRGKTTFLINQGIGTAKQGLKVLHIFLGDMSRFDGFIRYLSCYTGIDSKRLVEYKEEELATVVKKYNMSGILSNIDIASYAADQLTASQLIDEIQIIQKDMRTHYNVVMVDYDENISEEQDNMYKSGGQIYNKMALFSVINKSVVFIASQPKTEYWKMEVIPLEAASESSKKQKIIDLMLTIGKPGKSSTVGTLFVAKNRRGEDGKVIRIKFTGSNARVEHITEEEYVRTKQSEAIQ